MLGLAAWREIEERYGLALVRHALQVVVDAGLIEEQPVEPLAHMLLGAMAEAGLLIAHAEDPKTARREVGDSLDRCCGCIAGDCVRPQRRPDRGACDSIAAGAYS